MAARTARIDGNEEITSLSSYVYEIFDDRTQYRSAVHGERVLVKNDVRGDLVALIASSAGP